MVAAGMTANIAGPDGRRTLPVEEVTAGPGKTNLKRANLSLASIYQLSRLTEVTHTYA